MSSYKHFFGVTQKTHSALEWLINRQGFKNENQRIVSWATPKTKIKIEENFFSILDLESNEEENVLDHGRDAGQSFASSLNKRLRGYKKIIPSSEHIMIMGLEAISDGRISITYYQKFMAHNLLENLEKWEKDFSWILRYKKDNDYIESPCAPALKNEIWDAMYGENISTNLKKNFIKKILPCITEGVPFPSNIVLACVERISNRNSFKEKKNGKGL